MWPRMNRSNPESGGDLISPLLPAVACRIFSGLIWLSPLSEKWPPTFPGCWWLLLLRLLLQSWLSFSFPRLPFGQILKDIPLKDFFLAGSLLGKGLAESWAYFACGLPRLMHYISTSNWSIFQKECGSKLILVERKSHPGTKSVKCSLASGPPDKKWI